MPEHTVRDEESLVPYETAEYILTASDIDGSRFVVAYLEGPAYQELSLLWLEFLDVHCIRQDKAGIPDSEDCDRARETWYNMGLDPRLSQRFVDWLRNKKGFVSKSVNMFNLKL